MTAETAPGPDGRRPYALGLRNLGRYRGDWAAQFRAAAEIGVSWLQVDGIPPEAEPAVARLMGETGIRLWSITALNCDVLGPDPGKAAEEQRKIAATIQQAAKLGAPCVSVFAGNLPDAPPERVAETIGEVYRPLGAIASDHGIRLAVENCPMLAPRPPHAPRNFAYCPLHWRMMWAAVGHASFGLELDFGHLPALGLDPLAAIRELGARIHHVGMKDAAIDREQLFLRGYLGGGFTRHVPPGQGGQPFGRIIAALAEAGYGGPLTLDHVDFATDDVPMYRAAAAYLRAEAGALLAAGPTIP